MKLLFSNVQLYIGYYITAAMIGWNTVTESEDLSQKVHSLKFHKDDTDSTKINISGQKPPWSKRK